MDWLISNNFAANRLEAVTLASVLLEENFLRPVGARSMGAIRSGDLAEQFLDDSTALYTFVSYGTYSSCHQGRGKEGVTEWRPQWVGEKLWVGVRIHSQVEWVSLCRNFRFPCGSTIACNWGIL